MSMGEWTDKLWFIFMIPLFLWWSTVLPWIFYNENNVLLLHATTWLTHTVLTKRMQTQKCTYCVILFTWKSTGKINPRRWRSGEWWLCMWGCSLKGPCEVLECSLFRSGWRFHEYSYIKHHRIVHLRFGHYKRDVWLYIVLYIILFVCFPLLSIPPHRRGRPQCCLALELCAGAWGGLLSDSQSYTAYVSCRTRLPSPSTMFSAQLIILFLVPAATAPSARLFPGPPCRQPSLPADRQGSGCSGLHTAS